MGFVPDLPLGAPFTDLAATVPSAVVGLVIVSTPLAVGNALTNVSLNALVSRSASDDEYGGAFGRTQSAGSLATVFGPSLAWLLSVTVAYCTPFVVAGVRSSRSCPSWAPSHAKRSGRRQPRSGTVGPRRIP